MIFFNLRSRNSLSIFFLGGYQVAPGNSPLRSLGTIRGHRCGEDVYQNREIQAVQYASGDEVFAWLALYFDITLCFNNIFYRIFGKILRQFFKEPLKQPEEKHTDDTNNDHTFSTLHYD